LVLITVTTGSAPDYGQSRERYAMAAILSRSPSQRTICRYCGVETDTGTSHSSERECLDALAAEVTKAKRLLGETRKPVSPESGGGRRP
jgi:hypothetical protein